MLIRYFISVVIFIVLTSCVFAQKLKIGDKLPDIEFPLVLNNSKSIKRLSDFKGKLVILDYWNTWCTSCIASFPKLDSLQKKFKEEIVILPVSFLHKKNELEKFINKRKSLGYEIKLPLAVFESTDNLLFNLLPTKIYPHYIWIDGEGRLLYTSDSYQVNEKNIKNVLLGEKLNIPNVNFQMDFDSSKPFLINGNGGSEHDFVYRSIITDYIDSIRSQGLESYFEDDKKRLFIANAPIIELLKASIYEGRTPDVLNQFVVFENLDKNKFLFSEKRENYRKWLQDNSYCYELILPSSFSKSEVFNYMKQDIEQFFKIKADLGERQIDCFALVRKDGIDRIGTKSEISNISRSLDGLNLKIKNRNINSLIAFISTKNTPLIFDETGYEGNIDIDLQLKEEFDLNWMNIQLLKYGLELIQVKRTSNVIVIKQ